MADKFISIATLLVFIVFEASLVLCDKEEEFACGYAIGLNCVNPVAEQYRGLEGEALIKKIRSMGWKTHCKDAKKIFKCTKKQIAGKECAKLEPLVIQKLNELVDAEFKAMTYVCNTEFKTFDKTFKCLLAEENMANAAMMTMECVQKELPDGEVFDECTSAKRRMKCLVKTVGTTCGSVNGIKMEKASQMILAPLFENYSTCDNSFLKSRSYKALLKALRY